MSIGKAIRHGILGAGLLSDDTRLRFETSSMRIYTHFCNFILAVLPGCVSKPIHTVSSTVTIQESFVSPKQRGELQDIFFRSAEYLVVRLKDSFMLTRLCLESDCPTTEANYVWLGDGAAVGSRLDLKDLIVTDSKVTGENFYVLTTSDAPGRSSLPIPEFPNSPTKVEGNLWRGSPTSGGTVLVKKALFTSRLLITFNSKRAVEDRFKSWCYYLIKDEASFVLVPVFRPIRSPEDIHRVYLKELRTYADLYPFVGQGNWIIFDPLPLNHESETPVKIQIRGKFYPAKVQKSPTRY